MDSTVYDSACTFAWVTDYSQQLKTADNIDAESAQMWAELDALEVVPA